jgi:6-pyruvoyltetrahydropterin/6-carboxytetrahydropterin synthase
MTDSILVCREFRFEYAHRLLKYKGSCNNLHGHSGRVIFRIRCNTDEHTNMGIDFAKIKEELNELLASLDHNLLLNESDPILSYLEDKVDVCVFDGDPTAENIIKYFYDEIDKRFILAGLGKVEEIEFWETNKCSVVVNFGS